MHWLLALIGLFIGAVIGAANSALTGLVGGALLGWYAGRTHELRRRLEALEKRVATTTKSSVAPVPRTQRPPEPIATEPTAPARLRDVAPDAAGKVEPIAATASAETRPRESTNASVPPPAAKPDRFVPPPPPEPNAVERAFHAAWNWLTGGNVPVKVGLLVLLFGIGAALKYAIGQGWVSFPVELKLAAVAALGVAALVWGWSNREARPAFGLNMQGGGIGILLLTVFAAYRLAQLLPAGVAFALVVVLIAGAALLAVLQDAAWLAFIGFLGGYLAPPLLSTGSGNHVALFSYYAVLNLAVFLIAWKKEWRGLNLLGFFFTFGMGIAWGAHYYAPQHFASVEPFLILFFAFFFAIPVLHAVRGEGGKNRFVDATLVFGTPLLAFPLQAALLHDQRYALAVSALALALLYVAVGRWLIRRGESQLLGQSFAMLALGFGTIAVPLAFSAQATSAVWALEGAAAVWLGLRQKRWLSQAIGVALQFFAAFAYLVFLFDDGWSRSQAEWPVLNGHALSAVLLAFSAFAISWLYERARKHRVLVWLPFLAGDAWWTLGGLREILEHFDKVDPPLATFVAFGALTLAASALLRGVLRWPRLGWNVVAGLSGGVLLACGLPLSLLDEHEHAAALSAPLGWWWPVWFAAGLFALQRLREPLQRGISIAHVGWLASLALVYGLALNDAAMSLRLADEAPRFGNDWAFFAMFLPLIVLAALTAKLPRIGAFPLADIFPRYALRWFAPAAFVLGFATLASLSLSGDVSPLPYVPILNPAELAQLTALLVAVAWLRRQQASGSLPVIVGVIGGFIVLSLAVLRAVHHYAQLPWSPDILDNGTAQTALTVLWAITGVTAWIAGSRRRNRPLWMVGAILLGLVLAKLVLIDRQYMGNVAGIVSFLAVGGLLVLVGRIAPTPPKAAAIEQIEPEYH